MKVTDFVFKNNMVLFDSFRQGIFYYIVTRKEIDKDGVTERVSYMFQVPLEDIGEATLQSADKAIIFMRWIRKSIEDKTMVKLKP